MSLELKRRRRLEELSEEEAMRRHWERLDRTILERIERRFGEYIPKERLEHAKEQKSNLLKHEEYLEHLKRDYKDYKPEEGKRLLGDCRGGGICEIYIDREQPLVPGTVAHERLHQLRDERFEQFLGHNLHEGLTEYLARQISPDPQIKGLDSYPKERRLIEMLSARVGDDALKRAYFQGDWQLLKRRVESDLGEGALEGIVQAAEQGRYEEAERLLKGF